MAVLQRRLPERSDRHGGSRLMVRASRKEAPTDLLGDQVEVKENAVPIIAGEHSSIARPWRHLLPLGLRKSVIRTSGIP